MSTTHRTQTNWRSLPHGLVAGLSFLFLGACSTNQPDLSFEGIGFRESRYEEVSAMRDFRGCRDEALTLDEQARTSGDPARYLASARLLERCESELGPDVAGVSKEERMRAYGLTIQNYIKGGDSASARANLDRFKQTFPDRDLYYPDGSSFRETMEVLLGQRDALEFGQFATLNVSTRLKDEMRRVGYWKHN